MHLNHETSPMRFVALLPIIAAVYAWVLILEAPTRRESVYREGRAREAFGGNNSIQKIYDDYVPPAEHKQDNEKEHSEKSEKH